MLAIKYHHLRALIHRFYLHLPEAHDMTLQTSCHLASQRALIRKNKETCIREAQATALLLHSISRPQDLIEDFPWWQMIPCLLFSCSILLFASKLNMIERSSNNSSDNFEAAQYDEDELLDHADTLIRVFEALSSSKPATSARRMMQEVREMKGSSTLQSSSSSLVQSGFQGTTDTPRTPKSSSEFYQSALDSGHQITVQPADGVDPGYTSLATVEMWNEIFNQQHQNWLSMNPTEDAALGWAWPPDYINYPSGWVNEA